MTPAETATILRQFNKWLRGNKDDPQLESREINQAINAAIEMIERLEAAEKERDALRVELNEIRYWTAVAHDTIKALNARIEAAEKEREAAYLDFIAAANPAAVIELLDRLEAAEKERDFAKTEIARLHDDIRELTDVRVLDEEDRDLIVAWRQGTATKPAPSVPDDVMRDAKRYRFLRAAKNIPISTEAARDPIVYDAAIDAAMLAAAPEAKP